MVSEDVRVENPLTAKIHKLQMTSVKWLLLWFSAVEWESRGQAEEAAATWPQRGRVPTAVPQVREWDEYFGEQEGGRIGCKIRHCIDTSTRFVKAPAPAHAPHWLTGTDCQPRAPGKLLAWANSHSSRWSRFSTWAAHEQPLWWFIQILP